MSKEKRQQKIIELITIHVVRKQEDLLELLRECGYSVTQATVSRDIKELRLTKVLYEDGTHRYGVPKPQAASKHNYNYKTIVSETVKEVESAMNFVCVKCPAGLANAACAAFDELHWDGVIGTLSGDDTFFVMCRNEEQAVKIAAELRKYINL
ncbi:MAG: arginine repressor [Oscillospiraceae bacterium]|nr:arginine repressor [Oscillospiraceae bacterium]